MLQNFLINLLVKAAQDERVREFVADQVARLADKLKDDLLPDLAELFPQFVDDVLGEALDSDPDLPVISDHIDVSEWLRKLLGR